MMIARRSASNCESCENIVNGQHCIFRRRKSCTTYGQYFAHNIGSGATAILAKLIERLQIGLVQCVTNDFDVHFVQILFGNAIDEKWRQRCVDQNGIVQFSRIGRNVNGLHLLETAQWMTFRDQFGNRALMQSTRNQQNDIVNHVAVRDEVQESRQWLDGMVAQMLEFNHQFFAKFIVNDGHRQWRWFIGQELTVISTLQVKFQICEMKKKRKIENYLWVNSGRRTSRASSGDFVNDYFTCNL